MRLTGFFNFVNKLANKDQIITTSENAMSYPLKVFWEKWGIDRKFYN